MDELTFFGSNCKPDPVTDDSVNTPSPTELSQVESINDMMSILMLSISMTLWWTKLKTYIGFTNRTDGKDNSVSVSIG
jgi:hypothetical protein